MRIHAERPEDAVSISRVTTAAFANAPHSGGNEARVIEALRQANALSVSLVGVADDGQIVGHVAFSPVWIDQRPGKWYGLGPVSVEPHFQRSGGLRRFHLGGTASFACLDNAAAADAISDIRNLVVLVSKQP